MYGTSTHIERMRSHEQQTRVVELFMAGDIEHAKQVIRRFCMDRLCCVTVTQTAYIYRGGEEAGFVVGIRNYPRFPSDCRTLCETADDLGDALRDALAQDSYMVVDHSGMTTWRTTRGLGE